MSGRTENVDNVVSTIKEVGGRIDRIRQHHHWVIYWSLDSKKLVTVASNTRLSLRNTICGVRRQARHAR